MTLVEGSEGRRIEFLISSFDLPRIFHHACGVRTVANRRLQTNHRRVTKRRQSLHLDAASYLTELLFFSNEHVRDVLLSELEIRTIRCLRQLGGLGVRRRVVPWLLGGSEDP